jgi:hypothetical protein
VGYESRVSLSERKRAQASNWSDHTWGLHLVRLGLGPWADIELRVCWMLVLARGDATVLGGSRFKDTGKPQHAHS